jgi:hypothetical protein
VFHFPMSSTAQRIKHLCFFWRQTTTDSSGFLSSVLQVLQPLFSDS